ncbi:MAG TPA: hypothetical protein VH206_22160 [Xanthobacteraceae bacterium]|nr:hypothetical protein [Xanthobacteraceae bacterium]
MAAKSSAARALPVDTHSERVRRVKSRTVPRLFHARMVVTRLEEWCVEATTAEEARALLASGLGHRCAPGESVQIELEDLIDE